MNLDADNRESRGSVSYTDYYSSEDGQIRRTANDNCFPIFVKPALCTSIDDGSGAENAEEDEEYTLTLKQAEEQKKQDVQYIFEQREKESQSSVPKPGSSYKKIGRCVLAFSFILDFSVQCLFTKENYLYYRLFFSRFRVESMEISDNDVRIKETSSLGSSVSSERSKFLSSQTKLDTSPSSGVPPSMAFSSKKSNNLLRSQSVYTPKAAAGSIGSGSGGSSSRSPRLPKQSSLSTGQDDPDSWKVSSTDPVTPMSPEDKEAHPTLTLASSFTDKSHVTFGFSVPDEKKD